MPDLIGQSTGRYHIIQRLGEGGMAIVYRAFDTHLDCDVAIKFIRLHGLDEDLSSKTLERFKNEAKKTARLTHPNIVPVTDYGSYEGMPYLVMRYLQGGTLKAALTERLRNGEGPYSYQQAAAILAPIARALELAHQNGIVHRDMKPSNILLTETGQPILTDFGIAKILASDETIDHTATGVTIGTPEYMAPEQWEGTNITHLVDIYALGVVFYELITGRVPFKADTLPAIMLKALRDPLPPPSSFVNGIPESVERIIYKAMARDTAGRYQDMGMLAKALENLTYAQKVPEDRIANRAQAPIEKKAKPSEPASEPRPRRRLVPILIGGLVFIAATAAGIWYWTNQGQPVTALPTNTPLSAAQPQDPAEPLPDPTETQPISPTLAPFESSSDLLSEMTSASILIEDNFDQLNLSTWERWANAEEVKEVDGMLVIEGNPERAPSIYHPGDLKSGQAYVALMKLSATADIQIKTFAENAPESDYLAWGIAGGVNHGLGSMMEGPGSGASRWKSGAVQGNMLPTADTWYVFVLRLLSSSEASVSICDPNMLDCLVSRLSIDETWLDQPVGFQVLATAGTLVIDSFKIVEFGHAAGLPSPAPGTAIFEDFEAMLSQAMVIRESGFDSMPPGWFSNKTPPIQNGTVTVEEGVYLSSPDLLKTNQGVLTRFYQMGVNACAFNLYAGYDAVQVKWGFEVGIRDDALTVVSSDLPGVDKEVYSQQIHTVDWENWLGLREDWTYSLLYMNGSGRLYLRVWRENNLNDYWEYQIVKGDPAYEDREWRYAVSCANGKTVIDHVKELQFPDQP